MLLETTKPKTLSNSSPLQVSRRTFLRSVGVGASALTLNWLGTPGLHAAQFRRGQLPRSTPEAQGISSERVLGFVDAVNTSKHEFHSFMLLRHGHVVAEGWWHPYRPRAPHMLYSLSKSFTSTGIGFAVAEGRLTVNDPVIRFFPKEVPEEISEHLSALRVKDLLTMAVGHAQDSTGSLWAEENWVRKFLSLPIPNAPGSAFLYNSGATYMLSAIVQEVTGQQLLAYLQPRLFAPLGIEGVSWETCPRGINTGGWGLKIRTEGLAKFGQLYLQRGTWNGKQLLPASWVDEATSFKIQQPAPDLERAKQTSDWHQGYCYQFWRCRHNAYRGDGAFGQFLIVMPEQDVVVAITSETSNMQGILDLVWQHLLPGMEASPGATTQNESALRRRLDGLALLPPSGQKSSPRARQVSGKIFSIHNNPGGVESVSLTFHRGACVFALKDQKGEYRVSCGLGRWVEGDTAMPGEPPRLTRGKPPPSSRVAATGVWSDPNTFQMTWRFYETPHHDTVTCRFESGQIRVEFLDSMAEMSAERKDRRPALEGQLAS